jgi:hypothetical protein
MIRHPATKRLLLCLIILGTATLAAATPARAQWLNQPAPGVPRAADGKADLSAKAPRTPDGRPDLSGVWQPWGNSSALTRGAAFQPWAEAVSQERQENFSKDMPRSRCLPFGMPQMLAGPLPVKMIQTPGVLVVLHEGENTFRQIFLDGRALPRDPQPTWRGYSTGHWEGDDLVVETVGLNGKGWLDFSGHPTTETLRLSERYTRRDFGHLTLQVTFDDPHALVEKWTSMKVEYRLMPDTDLLEEVCLENEKDLVHLVGK